MLLLALAAVITLILPHGSANAGNFSFVATTTYRAIDDQTMAVSEQYTVTNLSAREFLTQLKLTTPVDDVSGLVAKYGDGGTIPTSVQAEASNKSGVTYHYQQVALNFPRQNYGQGKTWSFSLNYRATGLIETHGGAHTVYVPAVGSSDNYSSYQAKIDVPVSFGQPHFQGNQASSSTTTDSRQIYTFSRQTLSGQSLSLSFGSATIYKVNFSFPLDNSSSVTRTQTVTLPPNLNNQGVQIESYNPAPVATHLDTDGNILADYRVPAHGHLDAKVVVTGQVKYLEYNLAKGGKISAIPANLVHQYTGATQYWQTSGAVGAEARKLTDPSKPVIENVRAMYNFVVGHLTYNPNKIKFNIRQGAAKALANPTNVVCLEYSDLLIAMLRSQGIPARMPVGYGYSGNLKTSDSVTDSLHSWVEAYVPGIGWMTLDPTWGEKFDLFGQSDLDHFAFAVWGTKDQMPAPVVVGGKDADYQYEDTTLGYTSAISPANQPATLNVQQFAILPFVSIEKVDVVAAGGQVSTQNAVKIGHTTTPVKNLAPGEHHSQYRWIIGKDWWQGGQASLLSTLGGQNLIVAHAVVGLSGRPLVWLGAGLAIGLLLLAMIRLRSGRRQNPPGSSS